MCANENCRLPYNPALRTGFSQARGLCPACCAAIASKNGWVLDQAIYRACREADAAEPKFRGSGRSNKRGGAVLSDAERYEADRLAELAKRPQRLPYIPSARGTGRKSGGGPASASGGNEGRY